MNKVFRTASIITLALCGSHAQAGSPMGATGCDKKCPADVGIKQKAEADRQGGDMAKAAIQNMR